MPTATAESPIYVNPSDAGGSSFLPVGMGYAPDDLEALAWLVGEARRPGQPTMAVEVGSWAGRTAITMADAGALVWCVDTWRGSEGDTVDSTEAMVKQLPPDEVFRIFCRNAGNRLLRSVFPCRGPSTLWSSVWPYQMDLVFIDADHRYPAVRQDYRGWWDKLRPGGIMAFHDFGIFEGVGQLVHEAFGDSFQLVGRCIAFVRK